MYRQYSDELCHYGIKGMKWGVRRYQNPDGTRTELGKRRERQGDGERKERTPEEKAARRKKAAKIGGVVGTLSVLGRGAVSYYPKWKKLSKEERGQRLDDIFSRNQKDGKDKPNISLPERAAKEAMKSATSFGTALDKYESKKSAKQEAEARARRRQAMSKMSDDELRKRINRLNLEKQYLDLTRPEADPNKWTHQEKIDLGTDILNGMLAAGSLAVSIYALKRKLS